MYKVNNRKLSRRLNLIKDCPLCGRAISNKMRLNALCGCVVMFYMEHDGVIRVPPGVGVAQLRDLYHIKLKRWRQREARGLHGDNTKG